MVAVVVQVKTQELTEGLGAVVVQFLGRQVEVEIHHLFLQAKEIMAVLERQEACHPLLLTVAAVAVEPLLLE